MPSISVVIADREKARRAACLRFLQPEKRIQVVAEARSSMEAIAAAVRFKPCILLLDLSLSREKGVALLPALRQKSPRTKVILLIGRASEARILEALSHGAQGYLEKKVLRAFLPKAVRVVDAGEAWVPRKMVPKIIDRLARLTVREARWRRGVGLRSVRPRSNRLRLVKA
jgi:DNA-binding NarL/FixJ family response regulator